jgi:hypothetical protein
MTKMKLNFSQLASQHSGLTETLSAHYDEAARICLDRYHVSPQDVTLEHGRQQLTAEAAWKPSDTQMQNAWANEIDATEAGAYGLALAGVELAKGLVAVRRAEHGSGADWYLGTPGTSVDDLESLIRLEVSGISRGSRSAIRARLHQKIEQAANGRSNLPAIAAVVEFSGLQIISRDLDEK